MRFTPKLCKQHIGFMFRKHWVVQGVTTPQESKVVERLQAQGITVIDANEFVKEKRERTEIQIVGAYEPPIKFDNTHPDWHDTPCRFLDEKNVLLRGVQQAQVITKTVKVSDGLPDSIEERAQAMIPPEIHNQVKTAILTANIFDCDQKKLPKIKDPLRPAHIFARVLGLNDVRKNLLTANKLLTILEKTSNGNSKTKAVSRDAKIVTSFDKEGDLIQFRQVSNILLTSTDPLKPIVEAADFEDAEIPDLYPIKHTISLKKENIYDFSDSYPVNENQTFLHPHTSYLHFTRSLVNNLYETTVTEDQMTGNSLLHCFTIASAYARSQYGNDVTLLPTPVTVQCIHSDGHKFQFGVLQLNTLDLNGTSGTKNIWYSKPCMELFENCSYFEAKPRLVGYNPKVFGYLSAFYNNH